MKKDNVIALPVESMQFDAVEELCRICSRDAGKAAEILRILEDVFERNPGIDARVSAARGISLLALPEALPVFLQTLRDPKVVLLIEALEIENRLSDMVGLIYASGPQIAIQKLSSMLNHPADIVRQYSTGQLLLLGVMLPEAHSALAKSIERGNEYAMRFLATGYCEANRLSVKGKDAVHSHAALVFYRRVNEGGEFAICEGSMRRALETYAGRGVALDASASQRMDARRRIAEAAETISDGKKKFHRAAPIKKGDAARAITLQGKTFFLVKGGQG